MPTLLPIILPAYSYPQAASNWAVKVLDQRTSEYFLCLNMRKCLRVRSIQAPLKIPPCASTEEGAEGCHASHLVCVAFIFLGAQVLSGMFGLSRFTKGVLA